MKTIKDRDYSFIHTKRRLLERYAIIIERTDYEYLCNRVKTKDDVTVVMTEIQGGDTQTTYDLKMSFCPDVRVVWSKKRDCITTVLERKENESNKTKTKESNTT